MENQSDLLERCLDILAPVYWASVIRHLCVHFVFVHKACANGSTSDASCCMFTTTENAHTATSLGDALNKILKAQKYDEIFLKTRASF